MVKMLFKICEFTLNHLNQMWFPAVEFAVTVAMAAVLFAVCYLPCPCSQTELSMGTDDSLVCILDVPCVYPDPRIAAKHLSKYVHRSVVAQNRLTSVHPASEGINKGKRIEKLKSN